MPCCGGIAVAAAAVPAAGVGDAAPAAEAKEEKEESEDECPCFASQFKISFLIQLHPSLSRVFRAPPPNKREKVPKKNLTFSLNASFLRGSSAYFTFLLRRFSVCKDIFGMGCVIDYVSDRWLLLVLAYIFLSLVDPMFYLSRMAMK
ncbi:hypothetical protein SAY87_016259 [Trapa incisa]|uniref:Uncharacterized protein n=1 Tax=Trapa incisa TaxID=236973 RepID=A0AAN7QYV4_9MYRT|nr:hypothetical protein SAY87_016259 [Trapa incisa]